MCDLLEVRVAMATPDKWPWAVGTRPLLQQALRPSGRSHILKTTRAWVCIMRSNCQSPSHQQLHKDQKCLKTPCLWLYDAVHWDEVGRRWLELVLLKQVEGPEAEELHYTVLNHFLIFPVWKKMWPEVRYLLGPIPPSYFLRPAGMLFFRITILFWLLPMFWILKACKHYLWYYSLIQPCSSNPSVFKTLPLIWGATIGKYQHNHPKKKTSTQLVHRG